MYYIKTHTMAWLLSTALISSCSVKRIHVTLENTHSITYPEKDYNGQIWMTENLKNTTDPDGNKTKYFIPNNDSFNIGAYGLLYDYENACRVCPAGWHLPTEKEWEQLIGFIGEKSAHSLKDSLYWKSQEQKFTNSSGFSIRPAGYGNSGEFDNLFGTHALFWTNTRVDTHFVKGYVLTVTADSFRSAPQHPQYAFSVRCVKNKKK